MARNRQIKNDSFILGTLNDLVPQDHLVRQLEEYIDWDFLYEICDPLYSNEGTNRVDPVVLFKMMFINIIFGIHSMRRTCEEIKVNIAYRWFLGIGFDDKVPDHSTYSQNYIRKFKKDGTSLKIFEYIISEMIKSGIVDPSVVYVDGTHLKANANKNHYKSQDIVEAAKRYQKELDEEIDADRQAHFKKELNRKKKENRVTKSVKLSTVDTDCGYFHKGEKEKCFAYNINTACDRNGYVVGMSVNPGNVHDSVAFFDLKDYLDITYGEIIETYVADAGYSTPGISHMVHNDNQELIVPKKRTGSRKKNAYKKYQYDYNEKLDAFVCPMGCILNYSTTTRAGNRQYKSNRKQCESCPNIKKCTESKNGVKVLERHLWQDDLNEAVSLQKSPEGKEIYDKRKQTIERVFGDGKRRHGLDYTLYTGYERVYDQTILTFAGMNIKKLCTYYQKLKGNYAQNYSFEHQNNKVKEVLGLI